MTDQQNIFDENLINTRKKRIISKFPTFLHSLAIRDLKDRLTETGDDFLETLIVIRPGFIEVNLATLAALVCGICYGFYLVITRKLSTSDNSLLTLLFTGVVGLAIISLFMPSVWVNPTPNEWIMMAIIGLIASVAHLFIILSLKYADASKLAPLGYTEIITNIIISYYFFHELPDNWTYLGLFIIVLSGLYISRREYYLSKLN